VASGNASECAGLKASSSPTEPMEDLLPTLRWAFSLLSLACAMSASAPLDTMYAYSIQSLLSDSPCVLDCRLEKLG